MLILDTDNNTCDHRETLIYIYVIAVYHYVMTCCHIPNFWQNKVYRVLCEQNGAFV